MKTLLLFLATSSLAAANGNLLDQMKTRLALQHDTPCSYDDQFRRGTATVPCGKTRGTVLHVCGPTPKLKAHSQNVAWKGKTFTPCGTFTNRWLLGVNAIKATYTFETSLFDGQPCLVMQYPKGTPVFGGMRDEVREISPGTWLGRCTDSATGQLKNYFLLQAK
ncbi:hypothetical protein BH11PLA2_BH11PLA2_12730 [soil metagenome]